MSDKEEFLRFARLMVNRLMKESLDNEGDFHRDYRERCATVAKLLVSVCIEVEDIHLGK